MPLRDGTGPLGQGPMTGRGMGPCGRGYGFGRFGRPTPFGAGRERGFGYGMRPWGRAYNTPWTKKDEMNALEEEEKALEDELKALKKEKEELKRQK